MKTLGAHWVLIDLNGFFIGIYYVLPLKIIEIVDFMGYEHSLFLGGGAVGIVNGCNHGNSIPISWDGFMGYGGVFMVYIKWSYPKSISIKNNEV